MKKLFTVLLVCTLAVVRAQALTKVQMQTLATAITNAGYDTHLIPTAVGVWSVRATSPSVDVPIATVNDLAVNNGVSAFVAMAEFGPMTTVKMQAVVTAITNAGYAATTILVSAGSWRVRATSSALDIPTSSVAALATAQTVSAFVAEVEYR